MAGAEPAHPLAFVVAPARDGGLQLLFQRSSVVRHILDWPDKQCWGVLTLEAPG